MRGYYYEVGTNGGDVRYLLEIRPITLISLSRLLRAQVVVLMIVRVCGTFVLGQRMFF